MNLDTNVSIVASGDKWIGDGILPFQTVIGNLIEEASHSLALTAFLVTDMEIVQKIESALIRGVSVEVFHYEKDPAAKTKGCNSHENTAR